MTDAPQKQQHESVGQSSLADLLKPAPLDQQHQILKVPSLADALKQASNVDEHSTHALLGVSAVARIDMRHQNQLVAIHANMTDAPQKQQHESVGQSSLADLLKPAPLEQQHQILKAPSLADALKQASDVDEHSTHALFAFAAKAPLTRSTKTFSEIHDSISRCLSSLFRCRFGAMCFSARHRGSDIDVQG